MKKILLIAICAIAIAACTKNTAPPGTNNVITSPHHDTLILADDGRFFKDSINPDFEIVCTLNKTPTGSFFALRTFSTPSFPISMLMTGIPGPLNGIGVYKLAPIDSSSAGFEWQFTENFPGGTSYGLDSIMINVTAADINTVKGNYIIWLTDGTDRKTVNGIFSIFNATIN